MPIANLDQPSAHEQLISYLTPSAPCFRSPRHDLLIAEIRGRARIGLERYGAALTAYNGRDGLRDALEEAIDCCVYLQTGLAEGWCPPQVYHQAVALMVGIHSLFCDRTL